MEKFQKCPLYADSALAYIDGESLLLFFERSGRVYGLEREQAALFLQIDELLEKHEENSIPTLLPKISPSDIKRLIDLRFGRFEEGHEEYEAPLSLGEFIEEDRERFCYDTGRVIFHIAYPNGELEEKIDPLFAHMRGEAGGKKRVNVDFEAVGSGWRLLFNSTPVATAARGDTIPLILQENMIILYYQCEPYLMAIHAGAVGVGSATLLLPGSSGSGKSTLTAALLSKGHSLFSDEIALVDSDGGVSAIPFGINIKEGSWEVLSDRYPSLKDARTYMRFDGRRVKSLPPRNLSKRRGEVSVLVFPRYIEGGESRVRSLGACETLKLIKEAGYQLGSPLTVSSFEEILSTILSVPAYSMEYGSLEEGVESLERLVGR
ncbi:hypothetical protein NNO_1614 [Hydrogenimonas sp.]|nr:hypothetical protein NNO_1614 [Hydrogenimonas sp.]